MEKLKTSANELIKKAEYDVRKYFEEIQEICDFNQEKVLKAFWKNKIGEEHFYTVTGYGHDDIGREALDKVFADVFCAQKAIVRPHFVSGTHTLSCVLFGILRHGDTLLSVAGAPYDTMDEVIGHNREGSHPSSSLKGHGINYCEVPLKGGIEVDFEALEKSITPQTKMALIQRSRGYSLRHSISVSQIEKICKIIKSKNPNTICFVDNCYGEFVETREPLEVGADIIAGSLIKNPGGGMVEAGGYIAGREDLVDLCANHLTAPGICAQGGAMFNQTRTILQGFFIAPSVVSGALKGARLAAKIFEEIGFKTHPHSSETRTDLIQTIKFDNSDEQIAFCRALQKNSPVESYLTPIPDVVPGYEDKLIMAGGSFIEGSTLELSADGPLRPPYAVYMQGGLSYSHVKIALRGILEELQK